MHERVQIYFCFYLIDLDQFTSLLAILFSCMSSSEEKKIMQLSTLSVFVFIGEHSSLNSNGKIIHNHMYLCHAKVSVPRLIPNPRFSYNILVIH